jgi:hypothetical protein
MLTNEQVEQLFAFCRKHSVQYYDVQVELVDHLANAIEEKMTANPALSFEEALKMVYKGFGISGFGPVVKQKEKAVNKYNRQLMWKLVKQQLGWPKIFVALAFFAGTWTLLQLENKWIVKAAVMLAFVSTMLVMLIRSLQLQSMQKQAGKKFLLVNIVGMSNIVFMPINGLNVYNALAGNSSQWLKEPSIIGSLFFCTFFTLYMVLVLASCEAVKHVEGVLRKNYPSMFA